MCPQIGQLLRDAGLRQVARREALGVPTVRLLDGFGAVLVLGIVGSFLVSLLIQIDDLSNDQRGDPRAARPRNAPIVRHVNSHKVSALWLRSLITLSPLSQGLAHAAVHMQKPPEPDIEVVFSMSFIGFQAFSVKD